jgi:hypothetical protein
MNVDILNYKEKDKYMRYIYGLYQKSLMDLEMFDTYHNLYPQQSVSIIRESSVYYGFNNQFNYIIEKKNRLNLFIQMIENIHQIVSKNCLIIIENEYLGVSKKHWWKSYYSRSSYYRIKNSAIDEFFEYFDESLLPK